MKDEDFREFGFYYSPDPRSNTRGTRTEAKRQESQTATALLLQARLLSSENLARC